MLGVVLRSDLLRSAPLGSAPLHGALLMDPQRFLSLDPFLRNKFPAAVVDLICAIFVEKTYLFTKNTRGSNHSVVAPNPQETNLLRRTPSDFLWREQRAPLRSVSVCLIPTCGWEEIPCVNINKAFTQRQSFTSGGVFDLTSTG